MQSGQSKKHETLKVISRMARFTFVSLVYLERAKYF